MIKRWITYFLVVILLLAGCATKSYVRLEDERFQKQLESADSTIIQQLSSENLQQDNKQDSLYTAMMMERDSLFHDLIGDIYKKDQEIDSLQKILTTQGIFIDSLIADVDTLQVLQTRFKDANYSMFDFSKIKTNLDSLMINQKHLSRELQYMIRDLNLIERNLMDIMNYSMNSMKAQLQASNIMMERQLYKNNASAYKMIMVYLMTNSSSDPNKLLSYIDSVYAMGNALDTVKVQFGSPAIQDTVGSKE
ncbi:MAG: hypothetical protein U9O95_01260 [Candidatus Marinimicrobia bacterium]|nr:hypothetical protein [Candidatus Neomarinimicrobiota bacterium]